MSTGPNFVGNYLIGTTTWNPGTIANGATVTTTVTVTGATVGQPITAGLTTLTVAGVLISAAVTAANTVTVTLLNQSGSSQTIGSGTLEVIVWQH